MCRFWWRNAKTNKGIHWCIWSTMCTSKVRRGMGFKKLSKFNMALLAKQGWKLNTSPETLLARVMKVKYYPRGNFMSARLGFTLHIPVGVFGVPESCWSKVQAGKFKKDQQWIYGMMHGCRVLVMESAHSEYKHKLYNLFQI